MNRYEYNTITFFLSISIILVFCFCPSVLSMLSQNQTNTMIKLSQLLSDFVPWNNMNESNPCLWKGVTCDSSNSSVTMITLSKYSINSNTFLPVLCQLETLEYLDVSNNQLTSIPDGFIAECGKSNKVLKLLNFTKNNLQGPLPTFHGFEGLESLDMSFNHMVGVIDRELYELVSLKSLNLSSNSFHGPIPSNLGKSMVLEKLMLSVNKFSGTIPEKILDYKNLSVIDFSANNLSGAIPSNIGMLSKLECLILSSNNLDGEIPVSLGNITTLERFAANQNHFKGDVPAGITTHLTSLDLSYNSLGSIPQDLLSASKLQVVDLSKNSLSGPLPVTVSSSLIRLRLGGNSLTGTIPSDAFRAVQSLTYLELENNHLTGVIPAALGSCRNLALLSLAQNQLSGALPPELGNLTQLQVLKLHMNKLSGTIPVQIGQLQNLSVLNLSRNSLEGSIPSVMSSLSNLTFLHLQENNLSGSIPTSIGNLPSLLELQLGKNRLSGVIPTMPRSLQVSLNLSSNLFSGPVPSSFRNLANLEILDLSNNRFSGEIPHYLAEMPALTQILLSNNQLSGVIPKFASYIHVESGGNKYLVNNTGEDNTTPDNAARPAKKGVSVAVAVLIAIAAAVFLVALVTLLVVLVSRHMYKVNDEHLQPSEDRRLPQVIRSNVLTPNGIHRSNIDFSAAMEAVAAASNVTLKTRFSTYYKAIMPSGSIYFVKKLNWSDKILGSSNDKFVKELETLAKLNNSNVMTPLAYVLSNDVDYVLYEFVANGSLFDVLHGSMIESLDWASRYSIAVGVAQGLSFLHGQATSPILLLDLSSKSVMLKSFKEPLVGDIEHYKVIDPSKSTGNFSAVAGSVGYIPPEYAYTMTVTMAGNVYSFGVILLELLTGKPAVNEGTELVKWVSSNSATNQLDHILDFKVRRTSEAVRNQMLAVLKIGLVCVSTSPEARPKMKSVLRMLLNAR